MPKYLCKANYTTKGVNGVLKEGGTARRKALAKSVEAMGGKLEALYFAFGETDIYFIVEYPDKVTAIAASMIGNAGDTSVASFTPLITPEELDKGAKIAQEKMAVYRRPGE